MSKCADSLADALKSANMLSEIIPHPLSIPRTLTKSYHVAGIETDIWIQIFQDRLVFGVSQYKGSIGNFVMCEPMQSQINMKQIHYDVTNLLGAREETILNVYAQQLCEKIIAVRGSGQPLLTVVLGISLHKDKVKDPAMFRTILGLLATLYQDAMES
jgi:hypothetical protein